MISSDNFLVLFRDILIVVNIVNIVSIVIIQMTVTVVDVINQCCPES